MAGFAHDRPRTTDYTCFSMHVDDKFVAVSGLKQLEEFQQMLDMHNIKYTIEPMTQMLGMRVHYTRHDPLAGLSGKLVLDHDQYVIDAYNSVRKHELIDQSRTSPLNIPLTEEIRKKMKEQEEPEFDRERYKLFRKILGKVQHCSQYTHPEITTAVSLVSQRMMNPSLLDVSAVFGILRYLYGTVDDDRKNVSQLRMTPNSTNLNANKILCIWQ